MHVRMAKPAVSQAPVVVDSPTHWIITVDCSGSMYGVIGRIREQLKTKLPQLTKPGDLISLIWFSSRNEWGILQEAFPIADLTSLPVLNATIDKWLRALNLTGFVQPMNAVAKLVQKHHKPGMVARLFFLTDGQDNQWREHEILDAIKDAAAAVDDVVLIEYGYYCNHALMTNMVSAVGGALLFADNFDAYDGHLTTMLRQRKGSSKRVPVVAPDAAHDYGWTIEDGQIHIYPLTATGGRGVFTVPETVDAVYYWSSSHDMNVGLTGWYAAMYVALQRMDTDKVYTCLEALGDVALIDQFATCFSRQDYAKLEAAVIACVTDHTQRYAKGQDYNAVPKPDAWTVLDLLDLLAGDSGNKFHPYDPRFHYDRISRGQVAVSTILTDAEKDDLVEQARALAGMDDLDALAAKVAALRATKHVLKFTPNAENPGLPLDGLVYNDDRPNVSVRVRITGTVDLDANAPAGVPSKLPTYIWRNYAVIKDGIKHTSMAALPFTLSEATFTELLARGLVTGTWERDTIYVIDADLPVINRNMVKAVSAKTLFTQEVQLQGLKAIQKVLNTFWKERFERVSIGWEIQYGAEATAALKEMGLTEYGGFAPKTVQSEPVDVYVAKTMAIKIKGLSTLPAVNAALLEKVRTGAKLTPSENLMAGVIKRHDAFVASDIYTQSADQDALYKTWLESERHKAQQQVRTLSRELAKARMTMLVGHVWFPEFTSLDEGTLEVEVDGVKYSVTAILKDLEIKI